MNVYKIDLPSVLPEKKNYCSVTKNKKKEREKKKVVNSVQFP